MNEEHVKDTREELVSAREEKRQEIARAFNPNRMKVIRKELFANLRDPAVTIRDGNITFNTACINGLEDVVYVNLMIDEELGFLSVTGCDENDKGAIRWCVAKPDKRKSLRCAARILLMAFINCLAGTRSAGIRFWGIRSLLKGRSTMCST